EAASANQILLNGSGVAAGDVDGDGLTDLFFSALESGSKLYRNLGHWHFQDVTREAGLHSVGPRCTGAVFADVNGDGNLDLLVNSVGRGTHLFLNERNGHFVESTACGFQQKSGSTSLALADVDGDGDLDVYVANYRSETIRSTGFPTVNINGRRAIPREYHERLEISREGLIIEHGEPDFLYLNDGHGVFTPVSWSGGAFLDEEGAPLKSAPRDWGLSAMLYDVNGDGAPDLYVCNDFQSPDRFWLNDGKGGFRGAPALSLRSTPTFSMCVDFGDLDRDGNIDFFAADMLAPAAHQRLCQISGADEGVIGRFADRAQVERNTLQRGRGDGTFEDVASFSGLAATGWSWSVAFLDVDLDGFEDLLLTRGNLFNTQDQDANERIARGGPYARDLIPKKLLQYPALNQTKSAFRNEGHFRFTEVSDQWGFNEDGVAHGLCFADLDNDGDLDVVVNNLNGPAALYRNESTASRVAVRLKGEGGNRQGIGAQIELFGGAVPVQTQQMISGGRYLSGDDSIRVFAAGAGTNEMRLAVTWRSGKQTVVRDARPNTIYTVAEAEAVNAPRPVQRRNPLWFKDAAPSLGHEHFEQGFDDFARQGLLPRKLSQLGPGLAWIDLTADGRDELVIGSGRGGAVSVFEYRGTFVRSTLPNLAQKTPRDQTTLLGFPFENGKMNLLAGLANYEDALLTGASVQGYDLSSGKTDIISEATQSSPGPLALADLDGDGTLELFVGGRVIPGRYPEPASSRILQFRGGKWEADEKNSSVLTHVGLVSGATWVDLNRDGYPELILACEWGPIKIFRNQKGFLRDATREWGMDKRIGWWNGVSAGDFDNDGNLDLIVSNWGLNSKYQIRNGRGPRIYYAPWGGSGQIEPLEAAFDELLQKWVPE
ncbi:MAG TPA: VCBS repeat-containing protein, partial [Verrucomicrobiae bacterium]|nr:VCBS repeat-containing protein [Verrucomicrobiae bacterium]